MDVKQKLGAATGVLGTWFPEHQWQYRACIDNLSTQNPDLRKPVAASSFPASTINLGPATVCLPHCDIRNGAHTVCLNGTFGPYNGSLGGHLILHEARRVLALKHGDMVLFPSSCMTHENIPIRDGERRYSLTAYMAGALFRYRDQGLQTRKAWEVIDPDAAIAHDQLGEVRWEAGWSMFQTVAGLEALWGADARS
jgi:hypothetical protein